MGITLAKDPIVREGMALNKGERVEVYYNVHKGLFSIKSLDRRNPNRGRVVAHAKHIMLESVTFHESGAVLARILANGRKEVFAKVRGYLVHTEPERVEGYREGYCNPYKTRGFVDRETGRKLTEADAVYFYDKYFSYKGAK